MRGCSKMNRIKKLLERPLNDPMKLRDRLQCFLFFLTCLFPTIKASISYLRRNLPPMTHTPAGFKYGNNERVKIYDPLWLDMTPEERLIELDKRKFA